MALDYIIMGLATSIWLLLLGRILGGITASTHATAAAYVADISTSEQKAARFGYIGAGLESVLFGTHYRWFIRRNWSKNSFLLQQLFQP